MTPDNRKRRLFRPINSPFRLFYAGGADDAGIIKLKRNDLPLHGEKPTSSNEVTDLTKFHKKDSRWGHEKINIDNY